MKSRNRFQDVWLRGRRWPVYQGILQDGLNDGDFVLRPVQDGFAGLEESRCHFNWTLVVFRYPCRSKEGHDVINLLLRQHRFLVLAVPTSAHMSVQVPTRTDSSVQTSSQHPAVLSTGCGLAQGILDIAPGPKEQREKEQAG